MRQLSWLFTAAALIATVPARAADLLLAESIGLAGPAMFLSSGAPGMVLVVVRGDASLVQGYGETAKGNGREPDAKSLFRLGSITKVFTTEVLGSLVADGTMRLTDTLEHDSGGLPVPSREGRAITLLDLATHTAGLPREMDFAPDTSTEPTRADRWAWLGKHTLGWTPGTVAAYSNIGFDLLSDAIETATGKPYAALLQDRVTKPLGMVDTGFSPSAAACARLMLGSGIGGPAPCRDMQAVQGGGGLYGTGADMALWMRHVLAGTDPALVLSQAVYWQRQTLAAAIGFDEAGPMAGLCLGWVIEQSHGPLPLIVQKTGGLSGFMSYVAFAPGRGAAVFFVVNRTDFGMFHGLTAAANGLLGNLVTR